MVLLVVVSQFAVLFYVMLSRWALLHIIAADIDFRPRPRSRPKFIFVDLGLTGRVFTL